MKSSVIKLNAKIINLFYGKKANAFTLFAYLLKLFFAASCIFCVSALAIFIGSDVSGSNKLSDALYLLLFSLGIIFSVFFYILTDYSLKSEFVKTSQIKSKFNLFGYLNIKLQLKIVYLYSVKLTVNLLKTVLYLIPSAVCLIITAELIKTGMDKRLFIALCLLFLVLLITGAYFALCSCQRLAFLMQAVYLNKTDSAYEIIKKARAYTDGKCFEIAHFKLSFFIRLLSCLLIIPAFFVLPDYHRCISLYAIKASGVKCPRTVKEKPVVLMKAVKLK